MKSNMKTWTCALSLGVLTWSMASCNSLLDLEPVSQITPDSYFTTADQLASYSNNYYNSFLAHPYNGYMYHQAAYNDGMVQSDANTDILVSGLNGNTTLFADNYWEVPSGKNLQSNYFANIRVCNYFFETVLPKYEAGEISGNEALIANYIGEMYFMRALCYYRAMVVFGDFPIIENVLTDNNNEIIEASKRAPRNEVARFILKDLDRAAGLLAGRSQFNGQRVNKECALLFKSRVALYEGTFEKYHKGSGRVPGDSNWPGASVSYNRGKTFDINAEVTFFLNEAIQAAKQVADNASLTSNNHRMDPEVGTITGWNPFFEMFSQPSLSDVPEVLLWKQYNLSQSVTHNAPCRTRVGCCDGYTRTFVESFLMQDGLPIYASNGYKGDASIDLLKTGRDERLQLFIWSESNLFDTDNSSAKAGLRFVENGDNGPSVTTSDTEKRCITGYQPRKYYTYDYSQSKNDGLLGTNACPIFRTAEAMLNYLEAYYELNGTLDATARNYWAALRERAGITGDIDVTIAATDLSKEGDLAVYSGTNRVDATLYNIRRERVNELFSEGLRYEDLLRWRSFDRLITTKWIPEGINFWGEAYLLYGGDDLVADG